MSGFSPVLAIKNKITANTGGIGLRKTLVVIQFAITAILIVSTMVVIKQMSFIRSKNLGFDPKAVSVLNLPDDSLSQLKYEGFKRELLSLAQVKTVSFCSEAPLSGNNNTTSFAYNRAKDADFQVNTKFGDDLYVKTFGLQMVAGRPLAKSDTVKEFMVNETLLKKLGVKKPTDALGKILTVWGIKAPIVGVIKDFNNHSLHEPIEGIAITSRKVRYYNVAIKLDTKDMVSTMKTIEQKFNSTFPDYIYNAQFVYKQIDNYYETEKVMSVLFKIFSGVIIFISFIGLFGLISFVTTQRTKEIAIRKVLGASNLELVKMLNGSFLWMVLIANVVAWPIAYIFIKKWLAGFEYRIDLSIWPFVLATLISILITLITVSIRSYKAAVANTVDALKYE